MNKTITTAPRKLTPIPYDLTAISSRDLMTMMAELQAWVEYLRCALIDVEVEERYVIRKLDTANDVHITEHGEEKTTVTVAKAKARLANADLQEDVDTAHFEVRRVAANIENVISRQQLYSRELSRRQAGLSAREAA